MHVVEEKFGDVGDLGEIGVSVYVDGDYLKIDVVDNGVGILESIRICIFEFFFIIKEVGKGMG